MQLSRYKSRTLLFISALWFLAITAPSVLQLLDKGNPCITYTLNEEETGEEVETDKGEETIVSVPQGFRGFLLSMFSEKTGTDPAAFLSLHFTEVHLPPPEQLA